MTALLPVVLCGGGCLVMCWFMMSRMHRQSERGEPGRTAPGAAPSGAADSHDG
jgi:hypothetical protein